MRRRGFRSDRERRAAFARMRGRRGRVQIYVVKRTYDEKKKKWVPTEDARMELSDETEDDAKKEQKEEQKL